MKSPSRALCAARVPALSFVVGAALASFAAAQQVATEDVALQEPGGLTAREFGYGLDSNADWLFVGASNFQGTSVRLNGVVFAYPVLAPTVLGAPQVLESGGGSVLDTFGDDISVSGSTLAVGAPWAPDDGGNLQRGSVHVFELDGGGAWVRTADLEPLVGFTNRRFGTRVELDGDRLAVHAPGSPSSSFNKDIVFIYERQPDGSWLETQQLLGPDPTVDTDFGLALSLQGDVLAVGAPDAVQSGVEAGAVHLYERQPDASWSLTQTLLDGTPTQFGDFGASVDLEGDLLAVGAPRDTGALFTAGGTARGFERQASGSYAQVALFDTPVLDGVRGVGRWVDLEGERLLVGCQQNYGSSQPVDQQSQGLLYERRADGSWRLDARVGPADDQLADSFAWSMAFSGDQLAFGAPYRFEPNTLSGLVYLFEPTALMRGAPTISLAAGGTQDLILRAGEPQAGEVFLMLGSLSGSSPGVALGPVGVLPLNLDNYLLRTAALQGPLTPALANLDADGWGFSSVALPPGLPATLAGITAHHAYVTLDATTGFLSFVSNAVEVELTP